MYIKQNEDWGRYRHEDRKVVMEWRRIVARSTSSHVKTLQPAYAQTKLDPEWFDFFTYRDWRKTKFNADFLDRNGNPFHIDKDLSCFGNNIYCPEYCSFVPREINNFFRKNAGESTSKHTGVHFGKWQQVSTTVQCLGVGIKETKYFYDIELAVKWYKETKQKAGRLLADKWRDEIDIRVVKNLENIPHEFFLKGN